MTEYAQQTPQMRNAYAALMQTVHLLDDPDTHIGGRAKLARRIGVSRQIITKWLNYPETMPDARVEEVDALLAKLEAQPTI